MILKLNLNHSKELKHQISALIVSVENPRLSFN